MPFASLFLRREDISFWSEENRASFRRFHHPLIPSMEVVPALIISTIIFFLAVHPAVGSILRGNHLHVGFYNRTCPQAEKIIFSVVSKAVANDPGLAAGLVRLHFHDCFVTGCDASVLLQGYEVEMDSPANHKSLQGMDVVDNAKTKVEKECPGIVSCADIIAFAARDAASLAGLFPYPVPAGRRDGFSSHAMYTMSLPSPGSTAEELTKAFKKVGLTQEDLVVLSGAHSIGKAHCPTFTGRLYNPNPTTPDPGMDPIYAWILKAMCPIDALPTDGTLGTTTMSLDPFTPFALDNMYYVALISGKGLLKSDQALMSNPETAKIVRRMASNPGLWSHKFRQAMIRMGRIDVLTRNKGEIRHKCQKIN